MNAPAETLTFTPPTQMVPRSAEESSFTLAVRRARAITSSTLVPPQYQGEDNLGNAMIALDIADRTGMPPLMVMQHLYIVHGKPGWSATYLIATVNACGRFTPLRFEVDGGEDPTAKTYRVRAVARDKATEEVLRGSWITWQMADAEGWSTKRDSKWKTMPEQMFIYRAAAFWTRAYAPELSLGPQTVDELQDVGGTRPEAPVRAELQDLEARLRERGLGLPAPEAEPEAKPLQVDPDTGEVLPPELQE